MASVISFPAATLSGPPLAMGRGLPGPREAGLGLDVEGLHEHFRAWFGHSGQRYIVSVHAMDGADPACAYEGALLLAVRRDGAGEPFLLDGRDSGDAGPECRNDGWIASMRQRGATELHVHLLARDAATRQRTLQDLATSAARGPGA